MGSKYDRKDAAMNSKYAAEMLRRVNTVENPDREPTVKLDKETLAIVNNWRLDNLKTTVSWLCKIADEVLTEEKRRLQQ